MRYSLKEGLVLGVAIGIAVLLVRAFVPPAPATRTVVLLLLAVLLAALQLVLGLRRSRLRPRAALPQTTAPARAPRPDKPKNVFASETNQAWTGLHPPEEATAEGPRGERTPE